MRAYGSFRPVAIAYALFHMACHQGPDAVEGTPSTALRTDQNTAMGTGAEQDDVLRESLASRALSPETTFGALVRQVAELDRNGKAYSNEHCLLRAPSGSGPWRLSADLAVALRPLPDVPEDLDVALNNREALSVLTRWGHIGAGARGPMLAALTTSPPSARQQALIIIITDRGIYGRSSNVALPIGWQGGLDLEKVNTFITKQRAQLASAVDGIYVTAERDVPLLEIRRVLEILAPIKVPVAFATSLVSGTRQPKAQDPSTELLCPNGLPALVAGTAYGTLARETMKTAIGGLKERAERCMKASSGTSVTGDVLRLQARLSPNGQVIQTCFVVDEVGDLGLRRCIEKALLDLDFPAPNPTGYVDIDLPLRFVYLPAASQAPLCK